MTDAERIVFAIRSRGSNAQDLRDAAHEACHALDVKLRGSWERERLHRALARHCGDPGTMIYFEMRARAVEAVICEQIEGAHDLQKWVNVCLLETATTLGIALPSFDWAVDQVTKHKTRPATLRLVEQIKALAPKRAKSSA